MACIDEIVSIGLCDDEVSTSGYTLMTAAGMSPKNAANITTEQYNSIVPMLNAIKQNAINAFRTDFTGMLQANNVASTITNRVYDSAKFDITKSGGFYAGYRGQTIFPNTSWYRGNLRSLKITSVETYTLVGGVGEIIIADYDNGVPIQTAYPTTFTADTKQLHTLPEPYVALSNMVSVLIDNTSLSFSSSVISCTKGCNGAPSNICANVEGWDGTGYVKREGYGMNVQFSCECDYDTVICDLSKSWTGELIWLKMQELFYEEMSKSNRFTSWVIYNSEVIRKEVIPDLRNRYAEKFNSMISGGIFNILKTYQDDCLNCRGIRKVANV